MTNAKNKKSVIAIIAMAFLLVASIVLAATGAWFTAKASANKDETIKFGTVTISLTEKTTGAWTTQSTVEGEKMPGDSYSVAYTLKNTGSQDVYYKATATVTLKQGEEVKTITGITVKLDAATATAVSGDIYELAANAERDFTGSIELSKDLLNEHQGKTYTVSFVINVEAVQKANFTPATDTWPTME